MSFVPSEMQVALLCGGTSGEREISLASGQGAKEALLEAGFAVTELDPASKEDLKRLLDGDFSIAFLTLHGKGGEDGTIQGFLETIGLPYTGSGIQASANAIDKKRTKELYNISGVPTAPAVYLVGDQPYDVPAIINALGERCVVKPATEGSSLGVEIVEGPEALEAAIGRAFTFDPSVVVEKFIAGIEVTVPVLGNEKTLALPVIQMVPAGEFYDFESKYAPGGSQHICPAPLSEALTDRLQMLAQRAHGALGCRGVSRTDFIIDENEDLWALETNTLPGMTATSLLPESARAAGIPFPELCIRLIGYGLES